MAADPAEGGSGAQPGAWSGARSGVARTVLRSRLSLLLGVAVVALTVAAAGGCLAAARRTSTAFDRFVAWSDPPDVSIGGAGEDKAEALRADLRDPNVDVRPLYGAMSAADQDTAISPAPAGRRKVVLATSIAETSLTIDGVRVVVDAGLSRVPRFSPRTGMTRLETVRVSKASATQRAGRAGQFEVDGVAGVVAEDVQDVARRHRRVHSTRLHGRGR